VSQRKANANRSTRFIRLTAKASSRRSVARVAKRNSNRHRRGAPANCRHQAHFQLLNFLSKSCSVTDHSALLVR
jgi:hypothetical protein